MAAATGNYLSFIYKNSLNPKSYLLPGVDLLDLNFLLAVNIHIFIHIIQIFAIQTDRHFRRYQQLFTF